MTTTTPAIFQRHNPWKSEPTRGEIVILVFLGWSLFLAALACLRGSFGQLPGYGDNAAYLEVASAIQRWNFRGIDIQHFMGYPYAIASTSWILHISLNSSLWIVSGVASVVSTLLIAQLFGNRVAGYFALSNFAWIQLSFLGGAEPLALALGLGVFWSFRRDQIVLAALLGSLATIVRPLMLFSLVGVGMVLLLQKRYASFLSASAIGVVVGGLYVWPLAHYFGDPLLTVHSYTSRDYGAAKLAGPHGHLFGWPLHGIVVGTFLYPGPWTNMVLSFSWIIFVIAGVVAMVSRPFRDYWRTHLDQAIFCGLYLLAVFCYDYLSWARGNFMRFSIPALPFVFFALLRWLPRDRRVLWGLSLVGPFLAAASAVGIKSIRLFR